MAKYLVTGGAGFIGSHLSETLLKLGHKVIVIDNFSTSTKVERIDTSLKIYKTDIENYNRTKNIFQKEKPDFVYHLAGPINLRRPITDSLFKKSLNILKRAEIVLDFCLESKVKKIIFISSGGAIYSNAKIVPTPENYPAHPTSLYGLANLIIEKYIELYYKKYGLNYIILRLSNVYGPRQWESGIIPSLITNLLRKRKPIIYGDGKQTRDFIYVSDVIRACLIATKTKKRGIYNVGSSREVSLNKVFGIIKKILNLEIEPNHSKLVGEELRRSTLNIKKIKKELHWQPKTGLKEGLIKTIDWLKKNEKL
jgi:UDP-glucose 4-epimerase